MKKKCSGLILALMWVLIPNVSQSANLIEVLEAVRGADSIKIHQGLHTSGFKAAAEATQLLFKGHTLEADSLFRKAAQLVTIRRDDWQAAWSPFTLGMLSFYYLKRGDLSRSKEFWEAGLRREKEAAEIEKIKGYSCLERAIPILRKGSLFVSISEWHQRVGDFEKALYFANKALALFDQHANALIAGESQVREEVCRQLVAVLRGHKGLAYSNLAVIQAGMTDIRGAWQTSQKARPYLDDLDDQGVLTQRANQISIANELGLRDTAWHMSDALLEVARKDDNAALAALVHNIRSVILNREHQWRASALEAHQAVQYARIADDIINEQVGLYRWGTSLVLEDIEVAKGLSIIRDSINWRAVRIDQALLADCYYGGALAYAYLQDLDGLRIWCRKALREFSSQMELLPGQLSIPKLKYNYMPVYNMAMLGLLAQAELDSAFQVYSQARGKLLQNGALLHLLRERKVSPDEDSLNRYGLRLDQLRRTYWSAPEQASPALYEEMASLQQRIIAQRNLLQRQDPAFHNLRYPQVPTLTEIQTCLNPEEVLLGFALTRMGLTSFIITPDTAFHIRKKEEPDRILSLVKQFTASINLNGEKGNSPLELPNQKAFQRASYPLYQELIAPILERIDLEGKSLLIARDDVLNKLPFSLLVSNKKPSRHFHEFDYLLRHHPIRYVPDPISFYQQRKKPAPDTAWAQAFLGFGAPLCDTSSRPLRPDSSEVPAANQYQQTLRSMRALRMDCLPGTRQELKGIAHLFPEGSSQIFLDEAATKERLFALQQAGSLAGYRYLHFATHGLMDERYADLSGVVLSDPQSASQQTLLTTNDIQRMDLGAELVVLSACETGQGKNIAGEGVNNFAKSLLYAGARSLLVSLWKVPDQQTADFFIAFYTSLLSPSQHSTSSLRATQLSWADREDKLSHPYYWGSFMQIGEPYSLSK